MALELQEDHIESEIGRGWPPKRARWLQNESTLAFRQSYRNYRQGHHKGAKGEISKLPHLGGIESHQSNRNIWRDTEESIHESSIFQDIEDSELTIDLQKLEKWRIAYRNFRLGSPTGAEGELTKLAKHFTRDQLKLLPVAALAECLAFRVRPITDVSPATSNFHIHIGAGRLGLGLILPAIVAAEIPFAIFQRPSSTWACVIDSHSPTIQIQVNDDTLTEVYVVRSNEELMGTPFYEALKAYRSSPSPKIFDGILKGVLVLSSDAEELLLKEADSFSCSLGPGLKETLIKFSHQLNLQKSLQNESDHLTASGTVPQRALYACENDHQAVEAIRSVVENNIHVCPCMVDRICSDRIITPDKIVVTTERYVGEVVVSPYPVGALAPGFGGTNVLQPKNTGSYSYLYYRKILLVNGTHTTLAFMTLRQCCADPADAPGDYELVTKERMSVSAYKELLAWTVARCLVLLHSHEVAVIKEAQGISSDDDVVKTLWAYALTTIERFSTVRDSTKRVLGGGISNRYETRLKAILDTLRAFTSVPLLHKMLRLGGFTSLVQLQNILSMLVEDGAKFAYPEKFSSQAHHAHQIMDEHHQQFKPQK